jgi:hypothetical protein
MIAFLAAALLSATPPPAAECSEALSVDEPCGGALLPDRVFRHLLACAAELEAEQLRRAAELDAAKEREAAQRDRADQCVTALARGCAPEVEWWQRSEVVIGLVVVAVGALVAVVVLAVE